jgi:hypothetical protein
LFAVYTRGKKANQWVFERKVSLTNTLADRIDAQAVIQKPSAGDQMKWELSGPEFRKFVMKDLEIKNKPADYKIVIDATWSREDALLLEINNVFGCSDRRWTPLMLQLVQLSDDAPRSDGPRTPVTSFTYAADDSPEYIHEFLYLQCGHAKGEGKRSWGRVGMTNAALLYPWSFEYFVEKAGFVRKAQAAQAGR